MVITIEKSREKKQVTNRPSKIPSLKKKKNEMNVY